MANNKLVTIHQATSQRGGLQWNAWDGTFPLCYVILTNNVNEMASYLSPICMVVRGVKASLKVHPLFAGERIRASPTKRLWFLANMYKKFGWEKWVFKAATFPKHFFSLCVCVCWSVCMCVQKRNSGDEESSPPWIRVGLNIILHI